MKTMLPSSSCPQIAVFFLVQGLIAFLLFSYSTFRKNDPVLQENTQVLPQPVTDINSTHRERSLVILLWTWPFGEHFTLNQCPPPYESDECFFTADRSLYKSSDAVIFHHRDVCYSRKQMPEIPRPPGQYWVWFNLESPSHSPNLAFMDNLINLTMSYRSDSDIFTPYGWLEKNDAIQNFTIPKKSMLVAWVVSNWNPQSQRVHFYEELKKYIQIDIYGRQHKPLASGNMQENLSQYKFYLAFENSQHRDYITEKLWRNALVSGTVPIVLGSSRENYEKFIPRDSFIHVDDFPSAKQLADYLLELDKDTQKYEQYFKWRSTWRPNGDEGWATHYCKACRALKDAPPYRTIPTLVKWYT
ncbi:4-galactosyl-N-acetylglucosaminide 3-alpha-L-fucosyltransferase FUT6-like [Spea bombifrons]|uniref:4-galactosyl-N-acetylglucosaminide 3-alpha-L-fucosyltransferase FUT6-like n=1 Tax=Spea bombifrons TaxID=233779 RepID=UPI00234A46DF|nr:4-galactosyl-N-acetylglucosaminide 3-alpha-L-fucosyltransferase FUT6-like [Spea bombifrons]